MEGQSEQTPLSSAAEEMHITLENFRVFYIHVFDKCVNNTTNFKNEALQYIFLNNAEQNSRSIN